MVLQRFQYPIYNLNSAGHSDYLATYQINKHEILFDLKQFKRLYNIKIRHIYSIFNKPGYFSVSIEKSSVITYLHFRLSLSNVYLAAAGQTSAPPLPITHQHRNLMCPSTATIPQPKHPYGFDLRESPLPGSLQGVCMDDRNQTATHAHAYPQTPANISVGQVVICAWLINPVIYSSNTNTLKPRELPRCSPSTATF